MTNADSKQNNDASRNSEEDRRERIKLNLEYVKLFLTLIGLGSLIATVFQLEAANQSALQNIYQRMATEWRDHLQVFVENPNMRPYFTNSQVLPEAIEDREKVLAIADLRLDVMDGILTYAALQQMNNQIEGWKKTFAGAFSQSIVLCDRFNETKDYYGLIVPIGQKMCKIRR